MLTEPEGLIAAQREYHDIRGRIQTDVAKIVQELDKSTKRNARHLFTICAFIDGHVRSYQSFMMKLNTLRVNEEAKCDSRTDLLNIRRQWGELTSRTNLFRNEVNRWPEFRTLVLDQQKPKRRKLYWPDAKLPEVTHAQTLASDDVFTWLHQLLNPLPQSAEAVDHSCFPDIGLSNSVFHAHMHACYRMLLAQRRTAPIRFLDVGCGVGLKVYSALRYFDDCHGFDFDPAYVRAAQRFSGSEQHGRATFFEQDALTYDGYDSFDVIYFYRPSHDDDVLAEMEKRIVEQSKPGTILIAPYDGFLARHPRYDCSQVTGDLYLSQTTQSAAAKLRRRAELIGPYILKDTDSPLRSVWSPILDISNRNGFDLPHHHKKPRH